MRMRMRMRMRISMIMKMTIIGRKRVVCYVVESLVC